MQTRAQATLSGLNLFNLGELPDRNRRSVRRKSMTDRGVDEPTEGDGRPDRGLYPLVPDGAGILEYGMPVAGGVEGSSPPPPYNVPVPAPRAAPFTSTASKRPGTDDLEQNPEKRAHPDVGFHPEESFGEFYSRQMAEMRDPRIRRLMEKDFDSPSNLAWDPRLRGFVEQDEQYSLQMPREDFLITPGPRQGPMQPLIPQPLMPQPLTPQPLVPLPLVPHPGAPPQNPPPAGVSEILSDLNETGREINVSPIIRPSARRTDRREERRAHSVTNSP